MPGTRGVRFSGDVEIAIIHSVSEGQYACRLSFPGAPSAFQVVGEPAGLEDSFGAPEALDGAARDALDLCIGDFRCSDIERHAARSGT